MIANARMYAVNPRVATLWADLFDRVADRAGVPLSVAAHDAPLPLQMLWQRPDLGCAFMCGYPWSVWSGDAGTRPRLLAAPVPSAPRYGARPAYCTDVVVRADSRYTDLRELRGARFAYTGEHSQSGWHAARELFAPLALAAGGRFFGAVVGPLVTPRAVIEAVLERRADAGPLDSYWHDLLRRHEPATAARLRTLASTPLMPIPPLVCAAATSEATRAKLAASLESVASDVASAHLREALSIRAFATVAPADYAVVAERARQVDALGYPRLQ